MEKRGKKIWWDLDGDGWDGIPFDKMKKELDHLVAEEFIEQYQDLELRGYRLAERGYVAVDQGLFRTPWPEKVWVMPEE
jgi:hypothetical protein